MNKLKVQIQKLKEFFAKCINTYSEWLQEKKTQKHNKLTKKQFKLQSKIKTIDEKLISYIKKSQAKKQKLQTRLERVNNKLDKLNKVQPAEVVTEKKNSVNQSVTLLSTLKS